MPPTPPPGPGTGVSDSGVEPEGRVKHRPEGGRRGRHTARVCTQGGPRALLLLPALGVLLASNLSPLTSLSLPGGCMSELCANSKNSCVLNCEPCGSYDTCTVCTCGPAGEAWAQVAGEWGPHQPVRTRCLLGCQASQASCASDDVNLRFRAGLESQLSHSPP